MDSHQQNNNQIFRYIDMAYRRKWLIIIPTIVCSLLAAVMSINMETYYRSTTLILVEQQQVPERYVTPTDSTPFSQRLNTIKQQILSRTNLESIINDFDLYKKARTETDPGFLARTLSGYGIKVFSPMSTQEVVEMMREDINVNVIGGSRFKGNDAFSISYIGKDPMVTMGVTDKLASLFIEENLKIREQYVEGTSDFISNELEKAKKDLEEQEASVRRFKEKHMGSLPGQLDANLRTLDRLQLDLQSVTNSIKNADDRKLILEKQLAPITSSSSGGEIMSLTMELGELKKELSSLRSIYKENYPDVVILTNRIEEIKSLIASAKEEAEETDASEGLPPEVVNSEVFEDLAALKIQLVTLRKRQHDIRDQIKVYESRVEATPSNEQKLADILRDYNMSQRNYQALLEKKLNARLAENLEKRQKGERFRVLDPANLPEKPFKPNKKKITLMGTVAGSGAGVAFALLLEFINPVFRKPEDIEDVFGLPVLASIPDFSTDNKGGK